MHPRPVTQLPDVPLTPIPAAPSVPVAAAEVKVAGTRESGISPIKPIVPPKRLSAVEKDLLLNSSSYSQPVGEDGQIQSEPVPVIQKGVETDLKQQFSDLSFRMKSPIGASSTSSTPVADLLHLDSLPVEESSRRGSAEKEVSKEGPLMKRSEGTTSALFGRNWKQCYVTLVNNRLYFFKDAKVLSA